MKHLILPADMQRMEVTEENFERIPMEGLCDKLADEIGYLFTILTDNAYRILNNYKY